jgi:L-ribulose-5-phosphate 3-epimerase
MFQLGVRGHDFGKMPVETLADAIHAKGFGCMQLALAKAVPDIDCSLGKLSTGLAHHIGGVFAKRNIEIAVLGCYINPIHPDEKERAKSLARFKEHIRFVRDFGCSIVGTETGSVRADLSKDPENASEATLDILIRSVAELVAEAEKFGVFVCIEAVTSHSVCTPERMKKVIDTVGSNNLQVIFDPVNLLSADNYNDQDRIINESFELFGDRMMVLHAKDFVIEQGKPKVVPAGSGMLNYKLVCDLMMQTKPYIYTLLEDTKPEFLSGCREFFNGIVK